MNEGSELLKQRNGPIFKIHGNRELVFECQAPEIFGLICRETYGFLQHHVFARFQGLPGQRKPWGRRGGNHHGFDGWVA
jgi:hypothetical protein